MGNELSSITADDLQIQLDHLQKAAPEEFARTLLKHETAKDFSYKEIIEKGDNGFMNFYVRVTTNLKTLTTTAKQDVVLSLAICKLQSPTC